MQEEVFPFQSSVNPRSSLSQFLYGLKQASRNGFTICQRPVFQSRTFYSPTRKLSVFNKISKALTYFVWVEVGGRGLANWADDIDLYDGRSLDSVLLVDDSRFSGWVMKILKLDLKIKSFCRVPSTWFSLRPFKQGVQSFIECKAPRQGVARLSLLKAKG
ncbi:hypothetical protein HAX54_027369 [Datura stramonium]|uniref:Uncharacterized protein n=1 Tax=Datura stramonium TaxID=4076 RepID=A0ABS8V4G9_DATST|nr:hypothetical protein [Datura stramonium]